MIEVPLSVISLFIPLITGRPSPKVTWWRGGSLVDETYQVISSDGATQNTMTVGKLTRTDLHAVYTCQASNNNLSEPISSSVQVEMYCKCQDMLTNFLNAYI